MVATIAPGTYLTSSVRLLRPLGAGGMGEVWLAHHQRLDVEVAVKLIRAGWRGDDTGRARFEREAQAAARIDSPHVVRVFDYGVSDDGVPFIVMERLSGEGLDARIARGGPLPSSELADIFRQVARALAAAHALGIVHRDIKPANVFLSQLPDGVFAKVLDFGIAKEVALLARETFLAGTSGVGVTQAGTILGTPLYMSPEQFQPDGPFGPVTPAADVWGLGASLFASLTGQAPYPFQSPVEIFRALRSGPPPRARQLNRDLPRWLDVLCADCLQRVPLKRPSMSEVARRLQAREPRAGSRRSTLLAAAVAAALLLAAGAGAALSWPSSVPAAPSPELAPRSQGASARLALPPRESEAAHRRRRLLEERGYPKSVREEIEAQLVKLSESEGERDALVILFDRAAWDAARPEAQDAAIAVLRRRLSGDFGVGATRRYTAGAQSARIASFVHAKTGYELKLIPGSLARFRTWEDEKAQERVQLLGPLLDSGLDPLMLFFAFWQYEPKLHLTEAARQRLLPTSEAGRRFEQQLQSIESQAPADEMGALQARGQVCERLARFFNAGERWEEL
ncbi:MAG: serine/threonine protein kinase, partial [Myxococcales bacterium]|nr:serine/threonine protein kinase [Myxococcales bacterium]